jgi:ADP-L-glycero-D-manno-heptose 6-epimerase
MILVTGAAGFIGYRIARALQEAGESVIAVDELPYFGSRPEHADLKPVRTLSPEAAIEEALFESLERAGTPVRAVFHLGASSDTTEMRLDFLERVNVQYSIRLWEICTRRGIPFLYASSAATYGAGEQGYRDDESSMAKLKPLNPYGDSKLRFDLYALEQSALGKAPPSWSGYKFFNVYGFGERHKGRQSSVVLQGFDQIREKGSLRLFRSHREGIADGEQKRDFVFVDDVVEVMLWAWKSSLKRGIYNLGSGQARSFKDLALATFAALGKEPRIEFVDTPLEIRDRYQYFTEATMDKLKAAGYPNGFTPLEKGVAETVKALLPGA